MTAPVATLEGSRGRLLFLARWAAGLLILSVLAYFLPIAQLRNAISGISPVLFFALLLFYLLALSVGIAKWHLVVNSADARLPFSVSAQCYAGGLFGALFIPSIVGGDVVRLAVGISRSPRPASVVTGNVVDRLLDIAAQLTLVSLGLGLFPGPLPHLFKIPTRHLWIGGSLAAIGVIVFLTIIPRLLRGRSIQFRRRLAQLHQAAQAVANRPYRIFFGWLLGLCVQGTFLVITALLGVACGLHLPFRAWLFAWPLSKIAGVLPITQGGIGVRETAMVALLVPFGAPAARVLATGIAAEGIIIAGGLIAGLTAFLLRRWDSSRQVK